MKVKNVICVILMLALTIGLCACAKKDGSEVSQDEASSETTDNSANTRRINEEPLEHLIIDADVEEPDRDEYGVFSLQFSMPDTAAVKDRFFSGKEIQVVNYDSDSVYITSADGGEFSCNKYGLVFYAPERQKWEEIASVMNYYTDTDNYGETASLDNMTKEEAEELAKAATKDCAVGFTPVVTKCICMSHTDLMALQQTLLNDPDKHYDDFGKAFKLTSLDSSDNAYFVAFSFAYDDIPIFSQEEVSRVSYAATSMLTSNAMGSNGMGGKMIITEDGVKYLEIMGASFNPTFSSSSEILTVNEAVEKLAGKYKLETLQSDRIYSSIYIEYMPIEKEDGQIYLTPYWCFDSSADNEQSGGSSPTIISSTRFNAITGEDFSYGG